VPSSLALSIFGCIGNPRDGSCAACCENFKAASGVVAIRSYIWVSLSAALAVRSLLYWQQCWGKRSFVVMSKAAQLVQIFCPSSKQLMDATFWSCGFALKAICGSGEVSVDRLQRVTVMWWPGWTAIEGIEQTRECIHEHPNKPHRIAIALAEANEPIEWSSQLGVLLIQ
jgi:hypothetical protein